MSYDGENFPFGGETFDVVFSWSAIKHVRNIGAVLREVHRVLTPNGRAFVQVYPWFPARDGSHLTEWVPQPFHLRQSDRWVEAELNRRANLDPSIPRDFVCNYMLKEYRLLNRVTASDFYAAVRAAGSILTRARALTTNEDLSDAPDGVALSEMMRRGTMMLMRKGGNVRVA